METWYLYCDLIKKKLGNMILEIPQKHRSVLIMAPPFLLSLYLSRLKEVAGLCKDT